MSWISRLLALVGFRSKGASIAFSNLGELVVIRLTAKNRPTESGPPTNKTARELMRSRSRRPLVLPSPNGDIGNTLDFDRRYFELQGASEDLKLLKERIDTAVEQILMELVLEIAIREKLVMLITPRGKIVAMGEKSMSTLEGLIPDEETRSKFLEAGVLIREMTPEECAKYSAAPHGQIPNVLTPYAPV